MGLLNNYVVHQFTERVISHNLIRKSQQVVLLRTISGGNCFIDDQLNPPLEHGHPL